MNLPDILGWVGNAGFLIGAIWLARRKIYGFHAQVLANILYGIQALILSNVPLFWLSVTLLIFNCYGIYHWMRKEK